MTKKKENSESVGRPSKIEKIDLSEVTHYAENGYTDKELAKIFCVTKTTINNWKKDYPEFFDSLKKGKVLANAKVKASLFQRACGYSHPDVHIVSYLGKVKVIPIIKHYPPDTMAGMYWLNNREREDWAHKPIPAPDDSLKNTELQLVPVGTVNSPEDVKRFING